MGRLAWHALIAGQWPDIAHRYVFNTRALTNDAPYFAAYVKTADLPRVLDRLELLQDEWGYLLIWATLGVACLTATVLLAIPLIWGWRAVFSRSPGKALTVLYFACLGAGYIMVEVGLIAHFVMALGNPTISASVLITGMLVFSGLGALDLGARLAAHADGHAGPVRRGWGHVDSVRVVSRSGARRDRRACLIRPASSFAFF